ncbi:MAG: carboxymuconolactone decarboxylase family protein [Cycloclasticus sp.]|nr:carboxymuconolactone decarboxylase family protein [Cycloclasticus sp.]
MNKEYKLSLTNRSIEEAELGAKDVLINTRDAMGFIPNMYMYTAMANSPILLDTYASGCKLFREQSGFNPIEQEVVFLAISRENACIYCMAAHSFVADAMSKVPENITDAIRNDTSIPDIKIAELAKFTRTMVKTRGLPKVGDVDDFLEAGYSEHHVLDIIQAISVKTISNYANHLFHTELDDVFKKREWQAP